MSTPRQESARSFNERKYLKVASRLGSRWNRFWASEAGKADGRIDLYSSDSGIPLEDQSMWIEEKRGKASANIGKAEQERLQSRESVLARQKVLRYDLEKEEEAIAKLRAAASGAHCQSPRFGRFLARLYVFFFFLVEFGFTALVLQYSGLGSPGLEIAISVVLAAITVVLCELIGEDIRQLPLSETKPQREAILHYRGLWILTAILLGLLIAISALRTRTATATADRTTSLEFFMFGVALAAGGIFFTHKYEYSGPLYGLAHHERRHKLISRDLASCDADLKRLDGFIQSLDKISKESIRRLIAEYVPQYKRQVIKKRVRQ